MIQQRVWTCTYDVFQESFLQNLTNFMSDFIYNNKKSVFKSSIDMWYQKGEDVFEKIIK